MVSFLIVLSIRLDKTWESFSAFTPKLSTIIAISQLFLVGYTVRQRAHSIWTRIEGGQSKEEAEEASLSHFAIMSSITRRFLVRGAEG